MPPVGRFVIVVPAAGPVPCGRRPDLTHGERVAGGVLVRCRHHAHQVLAPELIHAEVDIERTDGTLVVEIRDDGAGGADPARGSGLRGLADRVAAVDGRLVVTSEPGAGTVVHAEIPCAR